ncbi:MAG: D-alanine--D-alanine ligase family protein [Bryobacterales bacterium]|nr:D-alanine--D-alanine ligase family protein [Bryobacterales bacterium]
MKRRVAVLFGGRSGEHDVSLLSARSVMDALDPACFEVIPYFIDKHGGWNPGPLLPQPGANPGIDVVFPVLHGTFGEDGTIQGLLELADLPYVGAGVLASSACMHKTYTKRICASRGIPVVDYVGSRTWQSADELLRQVEERLGYPCFVKPANLGSSVGISKASNAAELREAIRTAARFDDALLVERAISGQELECSILGNERIEASIVGEIVPGKEFYDYEDKYLNGNAQTLIPAQISAEDQVLVQQLAVRAGEALNVEGMARVDFFRERSTGNVYLNEVNTIPGFTPISMYGKMWEASGLAYPDLLRRLIGLAVDRHQRRKALTFAR